jgi:dienelactone hydrolase
MARAYTIATASLALGVPVKWIDNALSHHKVIGVTQQRQGISRRLAIEGLLVLAVALLLTAELGSSLGNALDIARDLVASGGTLRSSAGITIELDLQSLKDRLLDRLEHAVEVAPLPRRGRPPKNTTGRLD